MASRAAPLRLALFGPLPPLPTGVAGYLADLLPHLAGLADVDIYVDVGYAPDPGTIPPGVGVYPHHQFLRRRAEQPYHCAVYHLGNSPFHRYLYPYAVHVPGVAVLHDHLLHHLIAGMSEDGNAGVYFREMAYEAGDAGVRAGWEALMTHTEVPFYHFTLNRRVLDVSLGVVVHSGYLRDLLGRDCPSCPVSVVPMGIPLPPSPGDRAALRARLGLAPGAFVVGSFGQATAQKRLPQVLEAVAGLADEGVDVWYVVVGNVGRELDLGAELARWPRLGQRVRVTGYVDDAAFNAYLHAVDVCVNLRYPTAGETSAAALRCMAARKPTIVTDIGANRELPDDACLKLPAGTREAPLLRHALRTLYAHPEACRLLGENAAAYVAREHRVPRAAEALVEAVRRCLSVATLVRPRRPQRAAPSPLVQEVASRLRGMGVTAGDAPLLGDLASALALVDPAAPTREALA